MAKALLDQNGLDRNPHNMAPDAWYYEEPGGLNVFFTTRNFNGLVGRISWRQLRAALKRYDAGKAKKGKR